MRRILCIFLILTIMVASATTVVFADPWKNESGHFPPGLSKTGGIPPGIAKKFMDIDGYKWAQKAIEKMAEKGVIMGIGQGRFAPQNSVTKLEAIVMALRVMGEDDLAKNYLEDVLTGKKKLKFKDNLQEWAYGYVALAEENGILDDADILYFKLNDPATRHEVAKYLVRAMGKEKDALKHMDADLDFIDASFIPQGSVGYIYVAGREKLMTGYEDESFRPFNNVTRAEMAVMVERLDGIVNDNDDNDDNDDAYDIYRGEVTDIARKYIWIELNDNKIFEITKDTEVFFEDNEKGSASDLVEGDEIRVKANKKNEAVTIKVYRGLYEIYKGEVVKISNDYEWLYIETGRDEERFDISDDVDVIFEDGKEGRIEDLKVGDEVKIRVNTYEEILLIEVDRELKIQEYSGSVSSIVEKNDNYEFSVYTLKGKTIEFEIEENFGVEFNDEEGVPEDLRIGDEVEIIIEEGEVIEIIVGRDLDEEIVSGIIFDLYPQELKIALKNNSNNQIKIYSLDEDVKIYLNDDKVKLSDLEKKDYVGLKINDEKAVRIKAYRD